MWEKIKDISDTAIPYAVLVVIVFLGYKGCNSSDQEPTSYYYDSNRKFNGIDTLYSRDTAYIIHFTIDTAYYDPIVNDYDDPDPEEPDYR